MTNFKIFLFIFLNFIVTYAKISDLRLCADPACSEPVSLAKTTFNYNSDDSRILSFKVNQPVKVYSKSAGTRLDLWGAEINGKRGYVPMQFVRETKLFHSKLEHLTPTEGQDEPSSVNTSETIEIAPDAVTPPYEIIDGTTLYLSQSSDEYTTTTTTPSSIETISQPVASEIDNDSQETVTATPDPKLPLETVSQNAKETNDADSSKSPQTIEPKEEEKDTNDIEGKATNANASESKEDAIKVEEQDSKLVHADLNSAQTNDAKEIETEQASSTQEIETEQASSTQELVPDVLNTTDTVVLLKDEEKVSNEIKEEVINNEISQASEIKENIINNNEISQPSNAEQDTNIVPELLSSTEANELKDETSKIKENDGQQQVSAETIAMETNASDPKENAISTEEQEQKSVESTQESNNDGVLNQISKYLFEDDKTAEVSVEDEESSIDDDELDSEDNEEDEGEDDVADVEDDEQLENEQQKEEIKENSIGKVVEDSENENNSESVKNVSTNEVDSKTVITPEDIVDTTTQSTNNLDQFNTTNFENQSEEIPTQNINKQSNYNTDPVPSGLLNFFPKSPEQPAPKNSDNSLDSDPQFIPVTTESTYPDPNSIPVQVDPTATPKEIFLQANELTNGIDIENQKTLEKNTNEIKAPIFIDTIDSKFDPLANKIPPSLDIDHYEEESASVAVPGFFSHLYSTVFGSTEPQLEETATVATAEQQIESETGKEEFDKEKFFENNALWTSHEREKPIEKYLHPDQAEYTVVDMESCDSNENPSCSLQEKFVKTDGIDINWSIEVPDNAYNIFLYLSLTGITVLLFFLGYYYIEKHRKDGRLVASINELEKKLLISTKECLLVQDELKTTKERLTSIEDSSFGSNEMVVTLKQDLDEAKVARSELEEQVAGLEKELENATETGMELNRMLQDMLISQTGSENFMLNVEHLQKQLNEQQITINTMKASLNSKSTENELLQTELAVAEEKILQLQMELDKMVDNLLTVREEKSDLESQFEAIKENLRCDFETTIDSIKKELISLKIENKSLKASNDQIQRSLDVKLNEFNLLKEGMKDIQSVQSNKDSLLALLDVSKAKAEVQQLREEKHKLNDKLLKESESKLVCEKEVQVMMQEVQILKDKFDEAEKEKVEAQTRLEVLSSYFKDKEAHLQKEINENESKWMQKEGEATTTIERIKWFQEELQNYKSQNELLKKEILDQEVCLKSQISMLEKKSHDNWLLARQAERRLEEAKQEASQLRNRLTIVEKNLNNSASLEETKMQNRILSPLESNGDLGNLDTSGSSPLLFRDHTSPPLPPFLPPPPPPHGVPFLPPPIPGVPPFMPPPPALFPGDHRPPPLGRMSSPPLHGRYSPDSRAYSPYDRDDSPPMSPAYADNDYRRRTPPPVARNYSPYHSKGRWEEDREYRDRGQPHRSKPRPHKGLSSGSGNSNESLDNSGRHSGRV